MRPPRLARWLLACAAPRDGRADILADLDDEFAGGGHQDPRRWYWRQVRHSIGPLLRQRLGAAATVPAGIVRDLVFALRSLRSVPAFTAGVIVMLAVGIGSHLVVYAVVDGLLLRPLPFGDHSNRLVTVHSIHPTVAPDWDDARVSYPDLADMRRRAGTFEDFEAVISRNVSLASAQETDRVAAASITPGLFRMLDTAPMLGRGFTDDDATLVGHETSVILGAALWRSMFGNDPTVVGRPVLMNGRTLTVIGVMPEHFSFPDGQQLWLPFRGSEADNRASRGLFTIGLLRAGRSIEEGRAELTAIAASLAAEHPTTNRDWTVHVMPMREYFVRGKSQTTMLGAVSLVLLVVCANVAGLIVARGVGRSRELTLRAALGAGRARLVRLLVMETAVLAGAGGALGLLVATWGVRALVAWSPEPPPYWAAPEIDWRVAGFAVGLTAVVALAAGLLPALRISRVDAAGALLPGARANSGAPRMRRLQHWLVAGQVAFSFALLVGAGLLTRSATTLLTADGGFDPAPLLSLRFYIAGDRYDDPGMRGGVVNDVAARVSTIPGVIAAGVTGSIPTDDGGEAARVKDPAAPGDLDREIGVEVTPAGPTFWQALNLRLTAGRAFTDAETAEQASNVAIINARLAARLWPGESPVGRTLQITGGGTSAALRIVGIAPNLVYEEFGEETPQSQLIVYLPAALAGWRTQALLIRAAGDPATLAAAVRSEIHRLDPGFAVYDVMTMKDRRGYNHWGERFMGQTASAFAFIALLLASVGAYAIAAYTVAQRTREIGVRLALGASRRNVLRSFLTLGGRLAIAGALAGSLLAVALARAMQNGLFRVSPWHIDEWVTPAALLIVTVVAATYIPARRASRVDPAVALRSE